MPARLYRYHFPEDVLIEDVEASLLLAILATESLHGEARVRLDTAHFLDPGRRICVIDASTRLGRDLNLLFVKFLAREFGDDAFRVERIQDPQHEPQESTL